MPDRCKLTGSKGEPIILVYLGGHLVKHHDSNSNAALFVVGRPLRGRAKLAASAAVIAGSLVASAPTFAQDQNEQASAASSGGIEEIIVTARRKNENLQETPVAITAITGEGLEARNIVRVDQASQVVPNLVFEPVAPLTGSSNNGSIYIRGIGTTEFSLGTEPGVGVYVDEVYMARISGNVLDMIDIEALEVLRGPQGTLFGRNSIGGAILVRSKPPSEFFEGKVTSELGTDDLIRVAGSIDLPISGSIRTKISALRNVQDGYVEDVAGREDFGRKDVWSARFSAEIDVTANFMASINVDYTREKNSAAPYVALDFFDTDPLNPGALTFVGLSNLAPGCEAGAAGNAGGLCVDQFYLLGKDKTFFGYETGDRFLNEFNTEPFRSEDFTEVFGASLKLELDAGFAQFKSISSYRKLTALNPRNPDHTPLNVLEANSDLEQDQITQEFQMSGNSFGGSLDWITGFFYMKEQGYQLDAVALWPLTLHSGGSFKNENWAVFGQGTWDITDTLSLTGGLRYTKENKEFRPVSDDFLLGRTQVILSFRPFVLGIPGALPNDEKIEVEPVPLLSNPTPLSFSQVTPHVNVSWNASDDVLLYGSFSRGYKSGGFEQRIAEPLEIGRTFGVETLDSFEIGMKSTTPDRSLRFNAAAFLSKYKDLQCSVVLGIAPTFVNCGDGTLKGFEAEALWLPADAWSIDLAVGFVDASYDEGTLTPLASTTGISEDSKFAMVPKWSLSAGASYTLELGNGFELTPRADWSFKSKIYRDAANTTILTQGAYHIVNLALTLVEPDDMWEVALRAKNIGDEQYLMAGVQQNNGGFAEGVFARGREISVTLKVNF